MYELAKRSLNNRGNGIKSIERKSGELRLSTSQVDDNRVHASSPTEEVDREVVENEFNEPDVAYTTQ